MSALVATLSRPHATAHFALGGATVIAVAAALALQLGLPVAAPALSLAAFAGLTWIALSAADDAPPGFGMANRVTLARAGLVCLLAGLIVAPALPDAIGWGVFAAAVVAGALDAVDGWLARHLGQTSRFGARFDLETDALFIAVLAVLAWQADKAGPWVLAIGAMRYAFVAAALLWPRLRSALPPSRRRQTVCVVQVVALTACLAPAVTAQAGSALAAAALSLLALSFTIDIRLLLRTTDLREAEV